MIGRNLIYFLAVQHQWAHSWTWPCSGIPFRPSPANLSRSCSRTPAKLLVFRRSMAPQRHHVDFGSVHLLQPIWFLVNVGHDSWPWYSSPLSQTDCSDGWLCWWSLLCRPSSLWRREVVLPDRTVWNSQELLQTRSRTSKIGTCQINREQIGFADFLLAFSWSSKQHGRHHVTDELPYWN